MQIDRSIELIFPSAASAPRAGADRSNGGGGAAAGAAAAGRADTPARATPAAQAPATEPTASTSVHLSELARQLSLQEQLEQGKHQGLFTHLTYSRSAAMASAPTAAAPLGGSDAFARSAADVMREFSEGLAALQGPSADSSAKASAASQDLASRLRQGWQQVTARLSVRA